MSWINRVLLRLVQCYLVIVFALVVTPLGLLRRGFGRRPLRMSSAAGGWTRRQDGPYFHHQPAGRAMLRYGLSGFVARGRLDYALLVVVLLPVKLFLRVDKSTAVDPSIYVMY